MARRQEHSGTTWTRGDLFGSKVDRPGPPNWQKETPFFLSCILHTRDDPSVVVLLDDFE